MSNLFLRLANLILPLFISLIFLDSLRYKFTNAPETQVIFGLLDNWAVTLGAAGLFAQTGLFSQYVIGTVELVASISLLSSFLPRFQRLRALGALFGLTVMTGAISFHLFTPLGIDPNQDGGGLFMAACMVWLSCALLLIINRKSAADLLSDLAKALRSQS